MSRTRISKRIPSDRKGQFLRGVNERLGHTGDPAAGPSRTPAARNTTAPDQNLTQRDISIARLLRAKLAQDTRVNAGLYRELEKSWRVVYQLLPPEEPELMRGEGDIDDLLAAQARQARFHAAILRHTDRHDLVVREVTPAPSATLWFGKDLYSYNDFVEVDRVLLELAKDRV